MDPISPECVASVVHEESERFMRQEASEQDGCRRNNVDLPHPPPPPPPISEDGGDDSFKNIKPAEKHFPVSKKEVDNFVDRMEHVSRVLQDFLNEDPVEAAERKRQREASRVAARAEAEKQKLLDRYDPKRYVRFESDELINKLLEEVDQPSRPSEASEKKKAQLAHMSEFESLALEQAEAKKKQGNEYFAAGNWAKAAESYTLALELEPVDDDLCLALRNNRSQVNINLGKFVTAVEDSTIVLQRHPTNVKARMRRARALLELHRPHEALIDIEQALRGEPKNNDALRLAERIRLVKAEVERCREFEQRSKSAASQVVRVAAALKSVFVSDDLESVVMVPDAEQLRVAASTLVDGVDALDERGSETLFRLHSGGDSVVRVLRTVCAAMTRRSTTAVDDVTHHRSVKEQESVHTFEVQIVTASLRILALYTRSSVNTLLMSEEVAQFVIKTAADVAKRDIDVAMCRRLFLGPDIAAIPDDATSAVAKRKANSGHEKNNNRAAAAHDDVVSTAASTAALQLLEAMCGSANPPVVQQIVESFSSSDMSRLLHSYASTSTSAPPSAITYFALRFLDTLLRRHPPSVETYASVDMVGPCVACLKTKRVVFSEAAVGMLIRLSVAQPEAVQSSMTKSSDLIPTLCALLRTGLEDAIRPLQQNGGATASSSAAGAGALPAPPSPLLLEGICSLFFNRVLLLPSGDERCSFLQQLHKERCFSAALDWMRFQTTNALLRDAASSRAILNVAARVMGLLGKAAVSFPEAVVDGLTKVEDAVLWKLYDLSALFPAAAEGSPLCDAIEYVDEQKYVQQCIEHASICLAVLHTKANPTAPPPLRLTKEKLSVLLSAIGMLKRQPVTIGNIALILSVVPKDLHDVFGSLDCVKHMIDGLIALRTDLFDLEREGKRSSTVHQQTQSAQKNLAIALSRVCATEKLLERVRELRGFEVLYAALDRNPDGSIKEK